MVKGQIVEMVKGQSSLKLKSTNVLHIPTMVYKSPVHLYLSCAVMTECLPEIGAIFTHKLKL